MAAPPRVDHPSRMTEVERFPPDDPREWLNRARSSLLVARDVRFPYVHELKALLDLLECVRFLVSAELLAAAEAASRKPYERYPLWKVMCTARHSREAVWSTSRNAASRPRREVRR